MTADPNGVPVPDAVRPAATAHLDRLTWPQVEALARDGAILAVPLGATEQHGPHLPLSTDTDIAVALAEGLAGRRSGVLVAPPVPFGSSGEHEDFPGTLSIGQQATRLLLVELVRSAVRTFSRVLLVVGHGGNAAPVTDAVRQLRQEGHDVLAWAPRFGGDAHAGFTETSLLLALDPGGVLAAAAAPGCSEPIHELLPVLRRNGIRAVSPNGVLGDPTWARAEEGHRLIAAAVDELCGFLDRWRAAPDPIQS